MTTQPERACVRCGKPTLSELFARMRGTASVVCWPCAEAHYWAQDRAAGQFAVDDCQSVTTDQAVVVPDQVVTTAGPDKELDPKFVANVVGEALKARSSKKGPLRRLMDRAFGFDPMIIFLVVQLVLQVIKLWLSRFSQDGGASVVGQSVEVDADVTAAFEAELRKAL